MRKVVYHKNYVRTEDEAHRALHSKVVESEKELLALGADWGDHPSEKKAGKPQAEKPKEEVDFDVLSDDDLAEKAQESGIPKKNIKGKSREEIVSMIKEGK